MKNIIFIMTISAFFIFCYWVKCQAGINLFESFSLKKYLPVKFLNTNVVYASEGEEIFNENFDGNSNNWGTFWTREEGKANWKYERGPIGSSLLIESESDKDWSYPHNKLIAANFKDVFNFEGMVKIQGEGIANFCVILYDENKNVINWFYAAEKINATDKWVNINRSFIIPKGVNFIRFRLTGKGLGKFEFDDIKLKKLPSIESDLQNIYSLENALISYEINIEEETISVLDKRNNRKWTASGAFSGINIISVKMNYPGMEIAFADSKDTQIYKLKISLENDLAEIKYEIEKPKGEKFSDLSFPPMFDISSNEELVLPVQEGLLLPQAVFEKYFPSPLGYYGHSLSMPFIGVVAKGQGWLSICETPNDYEIVSGKNNGNLSLTNRWLSEGGEFGYIRRVRYCFFDKGDYAAMAKRYRKYARGTGLINTLKNKNSRRKGNISKLIGAVNIWYWGSDQERFTKQLLESGLNKVLFSRANIWGIKKQNEAGFLTSTYDNYHDIWPPIYYKITDRTEGWPEDLIHNDNGDWIRGWTLLDKGKEYAGGIACSSPGLERAKYKIVKNLKDNPYSARFLDTISAVPLRECSNPKHPLTRTLDMENKKELLRICSQDLELVTGSENAIAWAAPYCDYFEGIMSVNAGRLPDSGKDVGLVSYIPPTEDFLNIQVGEKYRIPLWQMVFGDCAVSTWYWGDSSNRIPEVWDRRDLFNILYGNMPLYNIRDYDHWNSLKSRFIESYKNVSPVFEKAGFEEMLSHKFINRDRTVQKTSFTNFINIYVNFGGKSFYLKQEEYQLSPKSYVVFEKNKIWKDGSFNLFRAQ